MKKPQLSIITLLFIPFFLFSNSIFINNNQIAPRSISTSADTLQLGNPLFKISKKKIVSINLNDLENKKKTNRIILNKESLFSKNNNLIFKKSSISSKDINLSSINTTFTIVPYIWQIVDFQNNVPEVVISLPTLFLENIMPFMDNEEYVLVIADDYTFTDSSIIDVIPFEENNFYSDVWYDFDGIKYFTLARATKKVVKKRIKFTNNDFILGDSSLELTNNFTVSAWIKNNGSGGTFISKGINGYNFKITTENNIQIDWNGNTQLTSKNTIDNNWHHIALTFSSGIATLYLDGILDKTVSSIENPIISTNKFTIGALYIDKSNISSFDGSIDEVRFWNTALTIDEIHYIMNQEIEKSGANVKGVVIPNTIGSNLWNNLVAYYDMNTYCGTTIQDKSKNNKWARIKYLDKNKEVVENQTAPIPYESISKGDWDNPSTWSNSNDQYLPNTTINNIQIDWNIVEINNNIYTTRNLTLLGLKNNIKELSINANNSLTISKYLLLNGSIDLKGESQLIQSEGSVLDDTSFGYIERDQQGVGNKYRYNEWSSPVIKIGTPSGTPYSIADILKDGTNPNTPGPITYVSGYDGNPGPPIQLSTYWMYKYANSPDGDYSCWQYVGSTGSISSGEGYTMKGTGDPGSPDQNYVFLGKPNNGNINLTISEGNDYLIGNPYPSAIDANKFIDDNINTITGTLHFWEHYGGDSHNLADYQAGYATYTKAGGVLASAHPSVSNLGASSKVPGRYIPVSQAFFVIADNVGGIINFNNNQRAFITENSGSSVFLKNNKEKGNKMNTSVDSRLKFRIGFEASQIDHRQILLTIDNNTTDAVDKGYDGKIYEILGDDMYWLINDEKYVIQATNSISNNKEMPIGIISSGGDLTIKIDSLENVMDNIKVYLKDKDLNTLYDLSSSDYHTSLSPGEYLNKYAITFEESSTLSVQNQTLKNDLLIFIDPSSKSIDIKNPSSASIKDVVLFNEIGQTIKKWNPNTNNNFLELKINTNPGIYFLKVITNKGILDKKLIINN